MVFEFRFPDVGEGIHEGQLVKWLVKEGDEVKEDQAIAEVETDKAIVEIPSPKKGTILRLHAKEGSIIKVGDVFATIGEKGEKVGEKVIGSEAKAIEAKETRRIERPLPEKPLPRLEAKASLRVRRLAQELNVDLSKVAGTGKEGEISEEDVKKASGKAAERETKEPPKVKFDKYGRYLEIPLSNVRKRIAEKMTLAKQKIPHVTLMDEADISKLEKVRQKEKKTAADKGIHLTYLPFIVRAVVKALKDHPFLNASWDEEKQAILTKQYYNIGFGVETTAGLIVPVIKNADRKSILEIAEELQTLSEKARSREISLEEMQGGTISITNLGSIGSITFTPIIREPEVAILGIGKIEDKVKVVKNKIEIRKIMPLSLAFDHRILDGAQAARFLNDIIKHLEDPDLMLVDIG